MYTATGERPCRPYPTATRSSPPTPAKPPGTSAGRRRRSSTWPTRSPARVLDAGCGTGENALFFAGRGHKVTGIDFLDEPINRAKQKAAERGLTATFLVMDALALKHLPEVFDTVIDSGLFHVFSDEDRRRYVEGLATVLKPGGRLFLLCFSDEEPGTQGPRRVSKKELHDAFADGWAVESIEPSTVRGPARPEGHDLQRGRAEGVVRGGTTDYMTRGPSLDQMFFEVGVPLAEGAMMALPPTTEEIAKMAAVARRY